VPDDGIIDLAALERELAFENQRLAETLLEPAPGADEDLEHIQPNS
jgi:hypothetical protein